MMQNKTSQLTVTAMLVALGVIGGSLFTFSIGVAKVAPMQHLINVVAGVLVGPWWALGQAFATSLIRNLFGTGTILAFPGSMIGAFLAGWAFRFTKRLIGAVAGELIGTGILGAVVAYPVARLFLGAQGALWVFIPSFLMSALVGSLAGYLILKSLWSTVILPRLTKLGSRH